MFRRDPKRSHRSSKFEAKIESESTKVGLKTESLNVEPTKFERRRVSSILYGRYLSHLSLLVENPRRARCVHGQLALSTELAVEGCNFRANPSAKCALALRVDSLLVGSTEPADRRRSDVALLPGVSKDASDQPGSRLVDHPQKQSPFRVETRGDRRVGSLPKNIFFLLSGADILPSEQKIDVC